MKIWILGSLLVFLNGSRLFAAEGDEKIVYDQKFAFVFSSLCFYERGIEQKLLQLLEATMPALQEKILENHLPLRLPMERYLAEHSERIRWLWLDNFMTEIKHEIAANEAGPFSSWHREPVDEEWLKLTNPESDEDLQAIQNLSIGRILERIVQVFDEFATTVGANGPDELVLKAATLIDTWHAIADMTLFRVDRRASYAEPLQTLFQDSQTKDGQTIRSTLSIGSFSPPEQAMSQVESLIYMWEAHRDQRGKRAHPNDHKNAAQIFGSPSYVPYRKAMDRWFALLSKNQTHQPDQARTSWEFALKLSLLWTLAQMQAPTSPNLLTAVYEQRYAEIVKSLGPVPSASEFVRHWQMNWNTRYDQFVDLEVDAAQGLLFGVMPRYKSISDNWSRRTVISAMGRCLKNLDDSPFGRGDGPKSPADCEMFADFENEFKQFEQLEKAYFEPFFQRMGFLAPLLVALKPLSQALAIAADATTATQPHPPATSALLPQE